MKSKVEELLSEYVVEEGWKLQRKFMHEVAMELEIEGKIPLNLLMCSQNVVIKWLEWVRTN